MKKLFPFLAIAGMFAVQSCEGPAGPPGPAGYTAESEVFEVSTSFSSITNYSQTYPLNPDIRPEDNILVYELYNVQDNIDTWALLPLSARNSTVQLQFFIRPVYIADRCKF